MEFLVLAGICIALGTTVVLLRHKRPLGMRSSIDEFEQSLDALAPPPTREDRGRQNRGTSPG